MKKLTTEETEIIYEELIKIDCNNEECRKEINNFIKSVTNTCEKLKQHLNESIDLYNSVFVTQITIGLGLLYSGIPKNQIIKNKILKTIKKSFSKYDDETVSALILELASKIYHIQDQILLCLKNMKKDLAEKNTSLVRANWTTCSYLMKLSENLIYKHTAMRKIYDKCTKRMLEIWKS